MGFGSDASRIQLFACKDGYVAFQPSGGTSPNTMEIMKWMTEVRALDGSPLRDRPWTSRDRLPMQGIEQIIVPQMPTDGGSALCSGTFAALPDAVSGAGGVVTVSIDTSFGGFSATHVGRKVKITYLGNGNSEIATVANVGGVLKAATVGTLGQAVISTTAADYSVDLADITQVMLTNPRNLCVVFCDEMRAYRKFEQEFERWRIDLFYEADVLLFNEDAIALQDGIINPAFAFGS